MAQQQMYTSQAFPRQSAPEPSFHRSTMNMKRTHITGPERHMIGHCRASTPILATVTTHNMLAERTRTHCNNGPADVHTCRVVPKDRPARTRFQLVGRKATRPSRPGRGGTGSRAPPPNPFAMSLVHTNPTLPTGQQVAAAGQPTKAIWATRLSA